MILLVEQAAARRSARIGKIALLRSLNDFGLLELVRRRCSRSTTLHSFIH